MDSHRLFQAFLCTGWFLAGGALAVSAQSRDDSSEPADKPECLQADRIQNYKVESDELVRFEMDGKTDILMRLKRHCPQLHFHKYMSYTPVNGQLCAKFDDIITRAGTPCRIDSLEEVPKTDGTQAVRLP